MKTLYEILEVSESASKEIIEKAYKVLAKKYHPDLQTEQDKPGAEKKMKELNEAYSILIDDVKRKEYDNKLKEERQEARAREESKTQHNKNDIYTQQPQQNQQKPYYEPQKPPYYSQHEPISDEEYKEYQKQVKEAIKEQQEMQRNMQDQYEQRYQEAYEDYLRSLGYTIKHKWTRKNYKDFFIVIIIIIVVCLILWFFPPTHNWIMDFYNSNKFIKTIIDIIIKILVGIWDAICAFFTGGNRD